MADMQSPAPGTTVAPMEDVPMPAIENAPPALFRPARDIGSADVWEIALMFLLEMSGSTFDVQPGGLRNIALSAARVAQLSDSARRFMVPASYAPTAPAAPGEQASAV